MFYRRESSGIWDKERYLQKYDDTDAKVNNQGLRRSISSVNAGSKCGVENQPQPDCSGKCGFGHLEVQSDFMRHEDLVLDPDGEDNAGCKQTEEDGRTGDALELLQKKSTIQREETKKRETDVNE